MLRLVLLIGMAFMLLQREDAEAMPVTFKVESVMEFGCGECNGFEEETGLTKHPGEYDRYDITALLNIDTNQAPISDEFGFATYQFDRADTLVVTVGKLRLSYAEVELRFFSEPGDCEVLWIYVPQNARAGFNTSNCRSGIGGGSFPDHSLTTFAKADLTSFSGTIYDTFVFGPNNHTNPEIDWWLQGGVRSIVRVPEPSAVALFTLALSLLGLPLLRARPHRRRR